MRRCRRGTSVAAGVVAALVLCGSAPGQERTWDIPVLATALSERLFLLAVPGAVNGSFAGNIAVLTGPEGALLVDGGLPLVSREIRDAVEALAPGGVRLVVNTHPHFDHTGGNDYFRRRGAEVLASEAAVPLMDTPEYRDGIEAEGARVGEGDHLPTRTVEDSLTLDWGGESVHIVHVPGGHSPADLIVHFVDENVVHMGDLYVRGYPFFDMGRGGSIDGIIAGADLALALLGRGGDAGEVARGDERDPGRVDGPVPDPGALVPPPRVIRGHGHLSDAAELAEYREMLVTVRRTVWSLLQEGATEDEVASSGLVRDLSLDWSGPFERPDLFVRRVYEDLSRRSTSPEPTVR